MILVLIICPVIGEVETLFGEKSQVFYKPISSRLAFHNNIARTASGQNMFLTWLH
jgi:hypothetical protein